MIETKTKTIDGHEYITTQFTASKGLKLQIKLGKILGAAIGELVSDKDDSMSKFLIALFSRLDEDETLKLIMELIQNTKRDNQDLTKTFDVAFAGDYMALYDVLGFVLEANFGSFFEAGGFGTLLAKILQPIQGQE